MLPRRGKKHVGAAIALAAVLAMAVAVPAGATGWGNWSEAWDRAGELLPRALAWLRLAPDSAAVLKCDQGSHIDPNGCPKALAENELRVFKCDDGSHIDPNGYCHKAAGKQVLEVERPERMHRHSN